MRVLRFSLVAGMALVGLGCAESGKGETGQAQPGTQLPTAHDSVNAKGQATSSSTPPRPFLRRGKNVRAPGNHAAFELDDEAMRLVTDSPRKATRRAEVLRAIAGAKTQAERRIARQSLEALQTGTYDDTQDFSLRTMTVSRNGYECVAGEAVLEVDGEGTARRRYATCEESWQPQGSNAEQRFEFATKPTGNGDLVVVLEAVFGGKLPSRVVDEPSGLRLASADGQRVLYGHGTWVDAGGKRLQVPARWTGEAIELRIPASAVEDSQYPAMLDPIVGPEVGTEAPNLIASSLGHNPDVASDGASFLTVHEVQGQIRAVRVDANGTPLDMNWLLLSQASTNSSYYPQVAYGNGHYLVTWSEFPSGLPSVVLGRVVNQDGTIEGSAPLKISKDDAIYSSFVWDKTRFVGVWEQFNADDTAAIHLGLFNADGTAIANSEKSVSPNDAVTRPTISASGSQFFVAWEKNTNSQYNSAWGSRVDSSGVALDTTPIQLGTGLTGVNETNLDVASDGTSFLAVWQRAGTIDTVQASLISAAGSVTSRNFVIGRGTVDAGLPTVDFDGADYVVAWTDARDKNSLYATKVSSVGAVLGSADTKVTTGTPAAVAFGMEHPALAFSGTQHLLVYYAANSQGVQGALLSKNLGITVDNIPLTPVPSSQGSMPTVVWNGSQYVVGFLDERAGFSTATARVMRYSATGLALDTNAWVLSTATSPASWIQLFSTGLGSSTAFWNGSAGNWFRSVSASGTLGAVTASSVPTGASRGAIASGSSGYLLPYTLTESSVSSVYGRRLDATGAVVGSDVRIDTTTGNSAPVAIATPTSYLVAYSRSGTWATPQG